MSGAIPDAAAIVVLGPGGLEVAERLKPILPGADVHGLAMRVEGADVSFDDGIAHLRGLFAAGRPIVGICAAGILIRAVAPLLADKQGEPPVVSVAEDGSVAVPLLGGHHGANGLARTIADALSATAAVTTAGDVALGLALDEPPPGWWIADPDAVKPFAAALLAGEPVALSVEAGDGGWLRNSRAAFEDGARRRIVVTDRDRPASPGTLRYHPPVLALGVGCERDTAGAELRDLAERMLAEAGLAPGSVAGVFSIDLKSDETAVQDLAVRLGVPARFFDAATLAAETSRLATPSDVVFRETGCYGVAEGAALAAAGPGGTLLVPKVKSARATCAVARAPRDIDPKALGRPRGTLAIVGIGPGAADWRTPEANHLLMQAEDIVGYGLYLDLIGNAAGEAERHAFPLGEEEVRVRAALDLAAAGRQVALVSSGDAGIYAMAALVFELLDRAARPDWCRVALTVAPGISALQAAAARAGAPLGHDFCAVSLSDLLTPWPEIVRRLTAAAEADFVTALYNPVSRKRRTQLAEARDILLRARPGETPVILARNLGRDGETTEITTLAALEPSQVDMLTLVIIGSSQSRRLDLGPRAWAYTPRGYAAKETTP